MNETNEQSSEQTTSFENKCSILGEIWLEYRDDENFTDFISYADLGLPLAYSIDNGIVEVTDKAKGFIEEAFELLLAITGVEDTGFEDVDELMEDADFEDYEEDPEDDEDNWTEESLKVLKLKSSN